MKGNITIGIKTVISFASDIEQPNRSPSEFPAKEIRKKMKQNIKNC